MRQLTLRAHPSRLACFGWARPEVHSEFGRRCGAPDRNQPIWLVHHGEGQIGPGDNATMRDLLSACSVYRDQDGVRGPPHGPWTPRGRRTRGTRKGVRTTKGAARRLASIRHLPRNHNPPARICGPGCTWVLLSPRNQCGQCDISRFGRAAAPQALQAPLIFLLGILALFRPSVREMGTRDCIGRPCRTPVGPGLDATVAAGVGGLALPKQHPHDESCEH